MQDVLTDCMRVLMSSIMNFLLRVARRRRRRRPKDFHAVPEMVVNRCPAMSAECNARMLQRKLWSMDKTVGPETQATFRGFVATCFFAGRLIAVNDTHLLHSVSAIHLDIGDTLVYQSGHW